jgi:hypothetical protein
MWNDYFSALCDHPTDLTSSPLKRWVITQRRNKNNLTIEKREALESIPGWKWFPTWDEQLAALREYVAANNKLPKRSHTRLGIWINTQRKRKDGLTAEKQAALEAIPGWVWKTREFKNRYSWEEQLAALHEHAATNNALPKRSHERLGMWISTQRTQYKKQKLSAERIEALQSIPVWSW